MIPIKGDVKIMKIEVWSDYVCPFCYIGKRRLEEAIEEAGLEDVEVIYKAFELEPNSVATSEETMVEALAKKYKISNEEAKAMTDNVAIQAQSVGLYYDFEKMSPANTFHAHRLAKFAEQEGLGDKMTEELLHAYFIEGAKIGTFETLIEISNKLGLPEEKTREMLDSEEFVDDVKEDIKEAGQIGVQGVPFFVINRKYAISGAQPTETFVNALQKAANETV